MKSVAAAGCGNTGNNFRAEVIFLSDCAFFARKRRIIKYLTAVCDRFSPHARL